MQNSYINEHEEDCPLWLRETLDLAPRYEQVEPGTAPGWTVADLVDLDRDYLDGLVSGDEYEHILRRRTS